MRTRAVASDTEIARRTGLGVFRACERIPENKCYAPHTVIPAESGTLGTPVACSGPQLSRGDEFAGGWHSFTGSEHGDGCGFREGDPLWCTHVRVGTAMFGARGAG